MTKKNTIKNWIISKIITSEWEKGDKIPSENKICIKFNVSRNPVREALKELKYSDWVSVKTKSHYYVSGEGDYYTLYAKGGFKADKTKIRDLNDEELEIFESFEYEEISKSKKFVKEYFYKNKMIMKTINQVDKNILFFLNNSELEQSFIQGLISHNVELSHQKKRIEFLQNQKISMIFGWENYMPIIIANTFSSNQVIENSIIIIDKKWFKFENKVIF